MTLQRQVSFWLISFLAFVVALWLLSPILLPFIAGLVLAYFLDPVADTRRSWTLLAEAGLKGHIVQIADPAEETLPFDGRNEFLGLDTSSTYLARKTENLRAAYAKAYGEHRQQLRDLARSLGWTFTVHRTDEAPTRVLLPLYTHISGAARYNSAASA